MGIPQPHNLILPNPITADRNPAAVYIASLAPGSRRTMIQALNTIADWISGGQCDALTLNWSAIRYQHAAAIRAQLAERYKPATANKMLSALRQVLHHAFRLGLMNADDYQRARDVDNVTGETIPAGRDLGSGELAALIRVCEDDLTPAGARDVAIIAIMYQTGIRRESVVKLNLDDYDQTTGRLVIRGAKRNKEYTTYIEDNGAQRAMADWLILRGNQPGPIFWAINKGGNMTARRLSAQAIYNLLVKRAKQAGIAHFSPHDLRRSLAGDLLDAGADIVTVQKILGHASVTTTARYDRRPEDAKRRAAGLVHVPYRGRKSSRTTEQ